MKLKRLSLALFLPLIAYTQSSPFGGGSASSPGSSPFGGGSTESVESDDVVEKKLTDDDYASLCREYSLNAVMDLDVLKQKIASQLTTQDAKLRHGLAAMNAQDSTYSGLNEIRTLSRETERRAGAREKAEAQKAICNLKLVQLAIEKQREFRTEALSNSKQIDVKNKKGQVAKLYPIESVPDGFVFLDSKLRRFQLLKSDMDDNSVKYAANELSNNSRVKKDDRIVDNVPHDNGIKSTSTKSSLLEELSKSQDSAIRLAVASNPRTPIQALMRLLNDKPSGFYFIERAVAKNAATTPDMLERIYKRNDARQFEYELLRNKNTPRRVIEEIRAVNKKSGPANRQEGKAVSENELYATTTASAILIANPSIVSKDMLESLLMDTLKEQARSNGREWNDLENLRFLGDPALIGALDNQNLSPDMVLLYLKAGFVSAYAHPNVPLDILGGGLAKGHGDVLFYVAKNPLKGPLAMLQDIIYGDAMPNFKNNVKKDDLRCIEIGLAQNPNADSDVLDEIASRNSKVLDFWLLANPSTSEKSIAIIKDRNKTSLETRKKESIESQDAGPVVKRVHGVGLDKQDMHKIYEDGRENGFSKQEMDEIMRRM